MFAAIQRGNVARPILETGMSLRGYASVLFHAILNLRSIGRAPIRSALFRQIYFSGIEAEAIVAVLGTMMGIVIITQATGITGDTGLTGRAMVWVVVRELSSVFTAIIVIGRSATAIAAELGTIRVNGGVNHLKMMGIDPVSYLLLPRVVGVTVSVLFLSVYFQAAAIAGGLLFSSLLGGVSMLQGLNGIFAALRVSDLAVSLGKSAVFGLMIGAVSCHQGFHAGTSMTDVPRASSRAVIRSLILVLVADTLINVLLS